MSEDEQIPFNNRTHDRLTELEKKLKDHMDWSINEERIEKLEKKVEALDRHVSQNFKDILGTDAGIKREVLNEFISQYLDKVPIEFRERIEKLEVRSAAHTDALNERIDYLGKIFNERFDKLDKTRIKWFHEKNQEIKSLKEQDLEREQHIQNLEGNVSTLQEVLLELLKEFESDHDESIHRSFFTGLIQKLGDDPAQNRIDRLDKGFEILKKHEEKMSTVEDAIKSAKKIIKEVENDSNPPSYIPPNWQGTLLEMEKHKNENPSEQDLYPELTAALKKREKEKEPTEDPYPSPYSKEQEDFAEHVGRIIGKENSDDYILVETQDLKWIFDTFELYMDFEADWSEEKQNKRIGLKQKYLKEIEE